MDTASFQFVLFGLAAAGLSSLSHSRVWRATVLMLASVLFLGLLAKNAISLLPLAAFLILGYVGLILINRGLPASRFCCILGFVFAYVWLKKYTFLPQGILLHSVYFTLGVSYIFFRVLHLLIETGDGDERLQVGPFGYLLYTLNFTTLISGPIQRYDEFARDQFTSEPITLGPRAVGLQMERLVRGFFKVNVLAMLLHAVHEDALLQVSHPLPLPLKIFAAFRLAIAYPFFLYANFSGYIDIVIAIARLMRVRLPENFDRPFSASSFIDFWNRWHITLSTWLKTYVYNPLLIAMVRRVSAPGVQPLLGVLSFFLTFFLVGVWHGRTSEFIVFGILQGGGVAINKLWQLGLAGTLGRNRYRALASSAVYNDFGRGFTFTWFAFTLFWFWADWKQIDGIFDALSVMEWLSGWLAILLCATIVLGAWERVRAAILSIRTPAGPVLTSRYARVVYASALGLVSLVFTFVLSQPAPDIVYKAF